MQKMIAEPRRVAVTGACGFIGAHLVRRLLANGDHVVAIDDLSTGDVAALPDHPRLELVIGSVLDRSLVRGALAGCATIFHLAGLVGMALATRWPAWTYEVSVVGTEVVLAHAGDAAVVLMSSSCVYGRCGALPCREADPIARDCVLDYDGGVPGYATGKWEMERMARRAIASGARVLVVRPFNVVGPGQSHRHGMVVPRFIRAAQRGAPLVVHGDGAQSRSFSAVGEFISALGALAALPSWSVCDHLVNLGNPRSITILELARIVIEETGSRSPIVHAPYASDYPGRLDVLARTPNIARVELALGKRNWADASTIVREILNARSYEPSHATLAPSGSLA